MELFLLFPDLQSKNFFHKMFLTFTNGFKTGFENRKLNYPNRKWIYPYYFLTSYEKTYFKNFYYRVKQTSSRLHLDFIQTSFRLYLDFIQTLSRLQPNFNSQPNLSLVQLQPQLVIFYFSRADEIYRGQNRNIFSQSLPYPLIIFRQSNYLLFESCR